MRDPSPRWGPVVALAAFVLLLCGAPSHVAPQPSDPAAMDTVSGTIHAVDAAARTLELLTGTGHALRLVRMNVAPDCEIQIEGAPASLADLERGQIVHIRYTGADDQRLARAIETIAGETPGGER